ncbi:MAG: VOC family protein [Burkholderiales bacterium]|jgi:predicted enzyme related to lactoylglutathione lyase
MKRVVGIGGIFFKSPDPAALAAWYKRHLGIAVEEWGGAAFRLDPQLRDNPNAATVWSPFKQDTTYFAPSTSTFMVNYRVEDLHGVIAALRAEGCQVDEKVEESEFGKFGWVVDPDSNKLELWEPPAAPAA